ncbi:MULTISPECIES: amino acid ABC transporter ATP-binding protein [Apilactobacillus]|uniref:Amino acid abc transporter, atp-binding protein n=1 Tax=Apilactobacillus kunkeei DSM 12361 = ATCC 700308 TaxID=1423768 RepID=A0A0R1FXK4_9LACO|nr:MULTISPECIES: amino acid ABC transporter ATP-binding protein [Apilactobacillus]KOY71747.1 Amino acid ABC transporter, ATP-binding protein [Apilactobacillus kunkeei DSM 12361 = ATCC 700308]KRK23351.1 amino acid abc transporter, atp-binding protein [Apilactobacillus kunkeei DSM 12361 = ATCC 700308]MCK8634068.1 amino acid ABC transporter ATP-binding protein [Apilactobacillus kunkeei]MDN2612619.1 amino acid ABC transporter ATP-binding protein [Apilactobacillus sp. EABW-1NA]QYU53001.1 amino acid
MINLKNVSKTFGKQHALDNISLQFPKNKTSVIVGPSGSGKSTLLRSLNLLETPETGEYDFNDESIDFSKKLSSKTILNIRRKTSMVFQSFNLFPHLTVLKNVMEGQVQVLNKSKEEAKEIAEQLLDKVGMLDKADAYPSQLSGGQAQRVAIARSLAMHPEYILLDEPTSALDPEIELEVLKVLLDLAKEKQSLVIVTHNLTFAQRVADKIVFIEDGKVGFDGDTKDFFESDDQRIKDFLAAMTLQNI